MKMGKRDMEKGGDNEKKERGKGGLT